MKITNCKSRESVILVVYSCAAVRLQFVFGEMDAIAIIIIFILYNNIYIH